MLKNKLFMKILLVLVAVGTLSACGSKSKDTSKDAKGLKIAIVSSPSGVDDGSFNQEIYGGLLTYAKNNKDAVIKDIKEQSSEPAAAVQAVADIVADYDVIVACGFQFAGIGTIAADNPDKKFILVDAYPTDSEGKEQEYENVYAMQFAEQEGGFYAGVAAALETTTNKVAVVNGIAYPSNVNYQFGFEAGVNYANKVLNTKVEVVSLPSYAGIDVTNKKVGGNYVGDFNDEAGGKVVGKALIDQGVDVMLVCAGGSGNGTITAAKEANNVSIIGCDVNQFKDGETKDRNVILTSVLKVMGMNVNIQLENVRDDKFVGKNELLDAKTDSTDYAKEKDTHQLSEATLSELAKVFTAIKDGSIVPPSNFSDSSTTDFPGLK